MKKIISSLFLSVLLLGAVLWGAAAGKDAVFSDSPQPVFAATLLQENEDSPLMKTEIENELRQQSFKGTALIIHDGQPIFQESFGFANLKEKQLNDEEVAYPVASLQKFMTAVMIQQLVSEKLITYDTSLAEFYPEISDSNQITVRQLLDHNSGIQMAETTPPSVLTTEDEQLEYTLDELSSGNEQEFSYTNANYTLLAGIIIKLTGKSYEENLQQRIIAPLHLKHTWSWDQLPESVVIPQAYRHEWGLDYRDDDFDNSQRLFSSLLGAGNLYMTAADLWTVQQGLIDGRLLSKAEYHQMAAVDSESYSGGLWHEAGRKMIHGSLGGFDTAVYGDETNETLVILLANQAPTSGADNLAETLFDLVSRH